MTLQEASNFFESLKSKTTKKNKIKVYEEFLYILTELKSREFSKDEIQSIETELDNLNLRSNPKNLKRFYKKALTTFEKYLRNTFSLTSKGHYTNMGVGLGASYGFLFGVVFLSSWERSLGISLGLIIGMLIGLTIGQSMEKKAKNESKVL